MPLTQQRSREQLARHFAQILVLSGSDHRQLGIGLLGEADLHRTQLERHSSGCGAALYTIGPVQFGPDALPVVGAKLLARHCPGGFAFDCYRKLRRAGPKPVADIAQVPDSGTAPVRERVPGGFLGQRLEIGLQIHAPITPDGVASGQHRSVSSRVSTPQVSDGNAEKLIRLANLRLLGLRHDQLSRDVGGRDTYWRDMLKGDKSFGEKIARKIEDRLQIPRLWLDTPQASKPPPRTEQPQRPYLPKAQPIPFRDLDSFEAQLVTLFRQLTPNLQHQVLVAMNKLTAPATKPTEADPYPSAKRRQRGPSVFGDITND